MAAGAVADTGGIYINRRLKSAFNVLKTKPVYEQFGFFVGILGPGCNACNSKSFTDAECDCRPYKEVDECGTIRRPSIKLSEIFKPAYDLLERVTTEGGNIQNLTANERAAVQVLYNFLENKDDHEKALKILLNKMSSETEITIALAEHLLGVLSPGNHVFDARTENKVQECPCGCQTKITYRSTGIGHEEVWHGFIDILFLSQENTLNTAATVATRVEQSDISAENHPTNEASDEVSSPPAKKRKKPDGESPGDKSITEVKLPIDCCENQAVSQAIVFALLQKSKHPDCETNLIPNIVISPEEFYIVMYDVLKDILICTPRYPIFQTNSILALPVVLIFWMVLHHKLLCSGVPSREPLSGVQSKFKLRASESLDIYAEKLRESVSCFPHVVIDHLECSLSTYYQEVSFI